MITILDLWLHTALYSPKGEYALHTLRYKCQAHPIKPLIPRQLKSQDYCQDLFFYAMSNSNPNHINYAHEYGIHSVAAAIIFAILYIPLFGWFVRQSLARPTYVYFVLTFFCASM